MPWCTRVGAASKGVDTEEYGFDFILNFMPQVRDFCETVQHLRELDLTRGVLDSLAVRGGRVHPVLDTQGSRTSRISDGIVTMPFITFDGNLPVTPKKCSPGSGLPGVPYWADFQTVHLNPRTPRT